MNQTASIEIDPDFGVEDSKVWLFVSLAAIYWWLLTALPILAVASFALSTREG